MSIIKLKNCIDDYGGTLNTLFEYSTNLSYTCDIHKHNYINWIHDLTGVIKLDDISRTSKYCEVFV